MTALLCKGEAEMATGFSFSNLIGRTQKADDAGMTRAQGHRFPRTQDRVLIVGTRDDCLILRDYSVVAAVGFGSVDDTLLSDEQINSMTDAFKSFLSLLRFDVQLLMGTRAQNLDPLGQRLLQRFDECAEQQRRVCAFRDGLEGYCLHLLQAFRSVNADSVVIDVPARFRSHFGFAPETLREVPGEAAAIAQDLARASFFAELLHAGKGDADLAGVVSHLVRSLREQLDASLDALDHWQQLLLGRRAFHDAFLQRMAAPVRVLHWVTRTNPRLVTGAVKRGPLTEGEFRSAQRELGERCAHLMHAMQRMGLPAWRATGADLIDDITHFYHPAQSQLAQRETRLERSVVAQMATVQEGRP
jgi:hypothetical protein